MTGLFRCRFWVGLCCLALLVALAYAFHLYSSRPLDFQRQMIHPLRALIGARLLDCQGEQADMLARIAGQASRKLMIPASQIALLQADGLSRCVHQWDGQGLPSRQNLDHTSRFRFASVTKPIVAATVLKTLEQQHIALTTPLQSLLPFPAANDAAPAAQIQLQHLLQHRSGLDERRKGHGMFVHGATAWCPGNWHSLGEKRLAYPPGQGHSYANANYCLLAELLGQLEKPWLQQAEQLFSLSRYDIRPIPAQGYMPDEVRPDFINSDFYTEDYYRYNDLQSGLPALGLSGSASMLAQLVHEQLLADEALRQQLLQWQPPAGCDTLTSTQCYMNGLAGFTAASGQRYYLHTGKLYGASALLLITEQQVLVWLGNGSPASDNLIDFVNYIDQQLSEQP